MKLLEWWNQRESRERYVLVTGIVFTLVTLLYFALEPSMNERDRMRKLIPQLQDDLAWMQSHVGELQNIMQEKNIGSETSTGDLSLASVQGVLNVLALQQSVNELSPMPNRNIRLNFNQIRYAELVELMYQLRDRAGARIVNASFKLIDNSPGLVQSTLILAGR